MLLTNSLTSGGRRGRQHVGSACLALLVTLGAGTGQAAEPLTLPHALERALAANPAVQSQAAELRQQELEKDIARGQRLPQADLFAAYTHHAYPSLVTPIREAGVFPPLDRDIASIGVALRVPLYAGGKLIAGESLAEHRREAAAHGLRAAGQDLLFNVTATYTKALHLRDLQSAARARIAALETETAHLAERLAQGRAAQLELVRLQTQLSQARHDLLALEQGERDARSVLAALLGTTAALPPLAGAAPVRAALPGTRDEALAKAALLRPELLRAQALERAAADGVTIAEGELRPQVDLVGRAQESAGGGDWRGYGDGQIGLELRVPLFDGSIRRNRLAQAGLERRKHALAVEEVADRLAAEIDQALGAVRESRARSAVARQGEAEAAEALRIETARYQAGEATVTDLLGAESALWSARVNLLQAGYDITLSEARLLRAIGELAPASFAPAPAAGAPTGGAATTRYVGRHRASAHALGAGLGAPLAGLGGEEHGDEQ